MPQKWITLGLDIIILKKEILFIDKMKGEPHFSHMPLPQKFTSGQIAKIAEINL